MNEETKQKSAIKQLWEQIVGVFGWVRDRWLSILVVVLLIFLIWITLETARSGNLGFGGYVDAKGGYHRGKTYWDWMELLIIPIVLAIGAWWLNKSERENEQEIAEKNREEDRKIADDRRNQATLEAYFNRMEDLLKCDLVDKRSEAGSFRGFLAAIWHIFRPAVKKDASEKETLSTIARTRTLAVLRSLDGRRKG
jgi:hypothetical protein